MSYFKDNLYLAQSNDNNIQLGKKRNEDMDEKFYFNALNNKNLLKGTVRKAEKKRLNNSLLRDYKVMNFSIFYLNTWRLSVYSLGVGLYFTMIKQLMILMFFIVILSICPLYLNNKGNYFRYPSSGTELSLGNIYGLQPNSTEELDENKMVFNFECEYLVDACCAGIFLLLIPIFLKYSYKYNIYKHIENRYDIADYSIQIEGLSDSNIKEEDLGNHFKTRFGEVKEVTLIRKARDHLNLYKDRARTSKDYNIKYKELEFQGLEKKIIKKKCKKLKRKNKETLEKIRNLQEYKGSEIIIAFVIFDSMETKMACLNEFKDSKKKQGNDFREKFMFQGCELKIKQAENPFDIIWENLEVSLFQRIFRSCLSVILNFIFLSISVVLIYYVKEAQSLFPNDSVCFSLDLNDKGNSQDDIHRLCYCYNLEKSDPIKTSNICSVYNEYLSNALKLEFASALGIAAVNFINYKITQVLASFESHHLKSTMQKVIFLKVFLISFINTSVLVFIVNLKIPNLSEYFFDGKFDDFNRDWYLQVGHTIMIILLISAFSPDLLEIIFKVIWQLCRKYFVKENKVTQYTLNKIYESFEFNLPVRTAQVINLVFSCFLYSGGIPILNLFSFQSLFLIFYIDKIYLFKYCKKPQYCDYSLYKLVIQILPFAAILHCCFSLYTFGSPLVFEIQSKRLNFLHSLFGDNLASRLERSSGTSNCILIIIGFIVLVFVMCINDIFKISLIEAKGLNDGSIRPLDSLVDEMQKNIEFSHGYGIKNNLLNAIHINQMDREIFRGQEEPEIFSGQEE